MEKWISYISLVVLLLTVPFAFSNNLDVGPSDETEDVVETEDRIGLNFNQAGAHSIGPNGLSGSNTGSFGIAAGIRYPNNAYRPLHSYGGSYGHSFAHGKRPPLTYSQSNRYGSLAGFMGGRGHAHSLSSSKRIPIPLGNGAVLLSNLDASEST